MLPFPVAIHRENSLAREIDRIIDMFPEFHFNRQQFVETAIREKIVSMKQLEKRV